MTSANGHGPQRAILYARVSTDEQARSGYSLAQQIEALRGYAAGEGYDILEEILDPGQSGASLERPGMDRVRDLVAKGGVSVVLAQDRDRIARKPAYNYLLQEEFEEHNCELKALNDYGDDSPEGKLMRGIQDQFAEYERAKTADRTRRGKLRKAKEGKLLRNSRAHYGFKFTSNGNAYIVDEEEMRVVRRIFHDVAAGQTLYGIKRSLEREGVSPPGGGKYWSAPFLRRVIMDDVYKPHTYAEIATLLAEGLLTKEVAAQLDDSVPYGVCWFNRHRTTRKRVSVEGSNGREYRWRSTRRTNPRDQWIAIPVPNAGIPRDTWDTAREIVRQNRSPSKTRLREFWELSGGILYCGGCGKRMRPLASMGNGRLYAYYRCARKLRDGAGSCPVGYDWRAEKVEDAVWKLISELMNDPQRLRNGLDELIEQERETMRGNPESEAQSWLNKLTEIDLQRARAQDLAIEGLLSYDELRSRLTLLDSERAVVERELEALSERQEKLTELERDRDTLMKHYAGMVPEALDSLAPEERHQLYRMLRLKVVSNADRCLQVAGAIGNEFLHSGSVSKQREERYGSGLFKRG